MRPARDRPTVVFRGFGLRKTVSGVCVHAGAVELEFAELNSANLSRERLRQLGYEFDPARVRVRGEAFADMALDLVRQRLRRLLSVCEDDECLHDVAPELVGRGDDGRLANRGVLEAC